jgi:protein-L-isoaspartate(D-aspartate) O-methyltransferase
LNNYANTQMVEKLNKIFLLKPEIKKAFLEIDRKYFVPESFIFQAYNIDALPLANDSTISSPLTVAKMTTYLEIDTDTDSVLEIGCGSGYQAAILSKLIRRVFAVERIRNLVIEAKNRFKKLNIHNVNLKHDDGNIGWKNYAPFDRILFSATAKEIPNTLFEQLNENGILLAPILKGNKEIITQFKKQEGRIYKKELEECKFVPIKKGKE